MGDGSFKAWPQGEHGKLDRLTFYTPELAKLQAGQPVIDQMVFQNDLLGEYVLYSFQKVGSVDCTGASRKGWYYHIGITREMIEAIVKKDCRFFIVLREISLSLFFAGKHPAENTNKHPRHPLPKSLKPNGVKRHRGQRKPENPCRWTQPQLVNQLGL